jgi:hypothetical protein
MTRAFSEIGRPPWRTPVTRNDRLAVNPALTVLSFTQTEPLPSIGHRLRVWNISLAQHIPAVTLGLTQWELRYSQGDYATHESGVVLWREDEDAIGGDHLDSK